MTLDDEVIEAIRRAIEESGNREVCGYLTADARMRQQFHRLANRSTDPDTFWISRVDFRLFERRTSRHNLRILALIHSHRTTLRLSRQDKISLAGSPIPWIVVVLAKDRLLSKVYCPEGSETDMEL
jgi:proteasome lid subunit RPN8/RPN11